MKDEFLKILDAYQGILHKVNLIYFSDKTDREDNFQEMVYQLWKSYPSLKNKNSIGSWIYSIAISTSIASLRKKPKAVLIHNLPEQTYEENFLDNYQKNENLRILLQEIYQLNEIEKSVILLYLEEKNHQEISEILGISKSNVGTKIHRIKAKLKSKIKILSHGK